MSQKCLRLDIIAELRPLKGSLTVIWRKAAKNRRLSKHEGRTLTQASLASYMQTQETKDIHTQSERAGRHRPQPIQVSIGELGSA